MDPRYQLVLLVSESPGYLSLFISKIPCATYPLLGSRPKIKVVVLAPPIINERVAPNAVRLAKHLPQSWLRLPIEAFAEHAQQLVKVATKPVTGCALTPPEALVLGT